MAHPAKLALLFVVAMSTGCRSRLPALTRPSVDLAPWVGLWTPNDVDWSFLQLSLRADGQFDYGFFPQLESAPNRSVQITGEWTFERGRIFLHERRVAHVPNRQMPHPMRAQIESVDTTLDVVPKRDGRVLVAPFPANLNQWFSLIRRSKTPGRFDWKLIERYASVNYPPIRTRT